MNIAIWIVSMIVIGCIGGAIMAKMAVRTAEDNWNVVFFVMLVLVFGFIDFVLIVIRAVIT